MPGRQSHGTLLLRKTKSRNNVKSKSLNAHSIASQISQENIKIRQHRLGILEEGIKQVKRPRDGAQSLNDDLEESAVNKRRKGPNEVRFDDLDEGSDSEGNKWKIGHVHSDDDSELDSDAAFGESDEERFEGFTFSGSDKKLRKKTPRQSKNGSNKGSSLYSSDESEASNLGEDAVDLATILDNDVSSSEGEILEEHQSEEIMSDSADMDDDSNGNSDDDDLEISSSEEDNDDDETTDPAKLAALQNLISNISQTSESNLHSKKTSTEVYASNSPSNFGLTLNNKITLEDLGLPTVQDPYINKSLRILDTTNKKSNGKLEVPLERRQQDRLDRDAAYKKSKDTLDRWVDTVKHNRRADHIVFPIPDHGLASAKSNNELAPVITSKPYNELEAAIQSILEESGLALKDGKNDEDQIRELEEIKLKESSSDVKLKRDQLRMARELLFYEETRLKRIKKIKSKSYRKVHRKQRDKIARLEQQALIEDGVLPSEDEIESHDRRRAEERMKSRHKSSRWTKAMKETGRTLWDKDVRSEITEMALREDELRKRVEGKIVRKEFQDSDITEDSDDDESEMEGPSGKWQKLEKLNGKIEINSMDNSFPGARLANMKFMQKAELAQKKQNDALIEGMKRELTGEPPIETSEDEEGDIGRRVFGQYDKTNAKSQGPDYTFDPKEANLVDDEVVKSLPANDKAKYFNKALKEDIRKVNKDTQLNPDGGAWSTALLKSQVDLESVAQKRAEKRSVNLEELDLSKAEIISKKNNNSKKKHRIGISDDSDSDSEKSILLTHDQDLIKRAFGGADVDNEFKEAKKRTILDEGDKIIDHTLPGWGNWIGDGISKKELKRNKNRFLSTSEGVQAHKRKDANLERVIINEKKIKKNDKYLASNLPHPFETRRQYERSLRIPIGPEWTTKKTFQSTTKPRILIKQGIISPISKPII
ncbi:putative small nucleolar ribonucleoprotein complex subunit utp14 [Erysiphe necator]|uniref:Putative small nucleolar ribonucleoprotein complex subunit utp14 n=1 Tax=Uncinula necator TaxID=52586 RepID=A0A0B1PAG8_UNCNE|nr:putative small nucleolar ribonucleoprotein complex subunit utp14 [Erysiphe necator]